jgi:hypothetical protein
LVDRLARRRGLDTGPAAQAAIDATRQAQMDRRDRLSRRAQRLAARQQAREQRLASQGLEVDDQGSAVRVSAAQQQADIEASKAWMTREMVDAVQDFKQSTAGKAAELVIDNFGARQNALLYEAGKMFVPGGQAARAARMYQRGKTALRAAQLGARAAHIASMDGGMEQEVKYLDDLVHGNLDLSGDMGDIEDRYGTGASTLMQAKVLKTVSDATGATEAVRQAGRTARDATQRATDALNALSDKVDEVEDQYVRYDVFSTFMDAAGYNPFGTWATRAQAISQLAVGDYATRAAFGDSSD